MPVADRYRDIEAGYMTSGFSVQYLDIVNIVLLGLYINTSISHVKFWTLVQLGRKCPGMARPPSMQQTLPSVEMIGSGLTNSAWTSTVDKTLAKSPERCKEHNNSTETLHTFGIQG